MKKVKIVCTLGPASSKPEIIRSMVNAGMNIARFNFSHGTHEFHGKSLSMVREVEKSSKWPIATILDTRGPEIRTEKLEVEEVFLSEGQEFSLYYKETIGSEKGVSVTYPEVLEKLVPGQAVFIDDGLIELEVLGPSEVGVLTRVVTGGYLGNSKGINLPGAPVSIPALSDKDRDDLNWGIDHEMDYVAVSFVKNRNDILEVRRLIEDREGTMKVIAKIETKQAVENISEIIEVVDGLMVARGDLGVELPAEEVPLIQKQLVQLCISHGKPVIVATQMLDSMIRNPRPTRAEASDVANAVLDGADAVMLSGETAKGKYPVESVKMMENIIDRVEKEIRINERNPFNRNNPGIPDALTHAAVTVAREMDIIAILSLTRTGSTARMVAKHRPPCVIIGSTPLRSTWRELALVWGVMPILEDQPESDTAAVNLAIMGSISRGIVKEGELLVITAGFPMGIPGTTNMLQLQVAGRILVNGIPYLKKEATGRIVKALTAEDALEKTREGDILVVRGTDKEYIPAVKKCAGLITEQSGLTSHPAILALEMKLPCVLGARNAMEVLEDGMTVTIDGERGIVYQGNVRLRA